MAVEGAHDSNIYIRQLKSFVLSMGDTSTITRRELNNKTFNITNKLVITFLKDDGSGDIDEAETVTVFNKYTMQTVRDNASSDPGADTFYIFDLNSDGKWVMLNYSKDNNGSFGSFGITSIVSYGGENPTSINFSHSSVNSVFVGASIGTIRSDFRKLKSIKNVSFSQNVQEENALIVGKELGFKSIIGPTQTRVAVDKTLNNSDYIGTLVGLSNISGQFEYGDNGMNFGKACINNFSVNATINELPEASFDLTIYGSLSGTSTSVSSTASDDNDTEEVKVEELTVTFDKSSTNAVQSFNFSETFNKQAFYEIGASEPKEIKTVGTIQQEASISIEVEDYEMEETFSFLDDGKDRSRTIKLEIGNPAQNTYQLQNASLVSESMTLGAGGTPIASLVYRGYRQ